MFSTSEITTTATGSKYLQVGLNEGVSILGITDGVSKSDKPFLQVLLSKADEAEGKTYDFYMTDAAQAMSLRKVVHLLEGAGVDRAAIDAAGAGATSLGAYAAELNKLAKTGSKLNLKLSGEEYLNASQQVKVRTVIGLPNFAEPAGTSPSRLKYSEDNQYDYKKMPAPDGVAGSKPENDLPF